jgi:hypothetical protein
MQHKVNKVDSVSRRALSNENARRELTKRYKDLTIDLRCELIPNDSLLVLEEVRTPRLKRDSLQEISTTASSGKSVETEQSLSPRSVKSLSDGERSPAKQKVSQVADYSVQVHNLCSSASSSLEMIRIAISSSPMCLRRRNRDGDLPLHVALLSEDPSPILIAELLNGYPDSAAVKSGRGYLPLFLACKHPRAHPSVLKSILMAYPRAAAARQFGSSALHMLAHLGSRHPESIALLLSADPTLAAYPNHFGNLPLHYLCAAHRPRDPLSSSESVRLLLAANPLGAAHLNKAGESPITRALDRWISTGHSDQGSADDLRLLLRSASPGGLTVHLDGPLRELNWQARKHIVMAHWFCRRERDGGRTGLSAGEEVSKDLAVLLSVVSKLGQGDLFRAIVSYL